MKDSLTLVGLSIQGAYWLPEDRSVLFFVSDRRYIELTCHRAEQKGSGKKCRICQITGSEFIFDAKVKMQLTTASWRFEGARRDSEVTLHIQTAKGVCSVTARLEGVTDENEVAFTFLDYVGYPPADAMTLIDLQEHKFKEDFHEDGPTQH